MSENLGRSLKRATSIARGRGRNHASLEDLLIALVNDEDASVVMQACGIDLARLRSDLDAPTAGETDAEELSDHTKSSTHLGRLLDLTFTRVQSSGRQIATGADLLVELFAEPVGRFLQTQGATRYDAVSYLSHGITTGATTDPKEEASGSPYLEIVLLNDNYTPMEFVVSILEEVLQISRDRAIRIMLSTHENKRASCGIFPRADAVATSTRIQDLAAARQYPLRCMLLPAFDGPPRRPQG